MKKLLPGMLALVIILCSCNAKKSFLTQRYTHLKHHEPKTVNSERTYANKTIETPEALPEVVIVKPEQRESTNDNKLQYTKSVVDHVMIPVVLKGKEKIAGLFSNKSNLPQTKLDKVKQLKHEQTRQKRGLLWGVIDAIFAIILLVVFVMLVLWLLVVLT